MAVLGRSQSGAPPDQILDPPLGLYNERRDTCYARLTQGFEFLFQFAADRI